MMREDGNSHLVVNPLVKADIVVDDNTVSSVVAADLVGDDIVGVTEVVELNDDSI